MDLWQSYVFHAFSPFMHYGASFMIIELFRFGSWYGKKRPLVSGVPSTSVIGISLLKSSAIIDDIKSTRGPASALVAYYYFDFQDDSKHGVRGLLASLFFQLLGDDLRCLDILDELYHTCGNGSEQPSDFDLTERLKRILKLRGEVPHFIIIDALDECPSTIGTQSVRDDVLGFVKGLVGSGHSNLCMCIASRPEQDIQAVLNTLTSEIHTVSLHEEDGQKDDINRFIHFFVQKDQEMKKWSEDDKALVISTLSERAHGM